MSFSFGAGARDSLSNLAASLGTGRDKASHDAFTVFDLGRAQIEAMYRGDWLARKVVDIVPYDSVRAWRSWSGHRADVARFEAAERRLGLRKTVQRAMTLGRLYGGGAILIGDGETDVARLARPLDPRLPKDGLLYLHALSRWQLGVSALDLNPLSPWCGEPKFYTLSSPGLPPLELHPSRVVRFLGNPLPDPSHAGALWSDSVLQALYDAVHAAALSLAGATSLLHEAKVDVVTVPSLSEHLSSAETTAQLSARFAYAAAMKSMNNLLLLGDGESWSRQSVDFAGLPEMARTFLQVAAGAADIPVTRLLGQSPSGLSATGESDVRNYYDMIAARQELDLRPQLERLDRLICWSEDIDEGALTFAFRPLWQLDEPARAALALSRAQATQVYAGLKLWPDAVVARLAEAQLVADGTYPNAAAVFAEQAGEVVTDAREVGEIPRASGEFWPGGKQPRDWHGRWTFAGGSVGPAPAVILANAEEQQKASEKKMEGTGTAIPAVQSEEPPNLTINLTPPLKGAPDFRGAGGSIKAQPTPAGSISGIQSAPVVQPVPGGAASSGPPKSGPVSPIASPAQPQSPPAASGVAPGQTGPQSAVKTQAGPGGGASVAPSTGPSSSLVSRLTIPPPAAAIRVIGNSPGERGDDYEAKILQHYGLTKLQSSNVPGSIVPESRIGDLCFEVKYQDTWKGSIFNSQIGGNPGMVERKVIEQAKKYDKDCIEGVIWITNYVDFQNQYEEFFRQEGVKKVEFLIIPSTR